MAPSAPFPGLAPAPSAWTAALECAAPAGTPAPSGPCRLCGDPAPVGLGWHHLDGDHGDWSPRNLAPACVLCHGAAHLNRPAARDEMALIWAPEMAQPWVNAAARAIHRIFSAEGESPALGAAPRRDTPKLRAAWRAYRALADRAPDAARIAGTDDPRLLGAALLGMRRPPPALDGLRLLPAGRHFRGGRDVYPDLLGEADGR